MHRFTDRVAVVTGAASGIGRALSLALAAKGCDLALVDINERELAETARRVGSLGRRSTTHRVDVADRASMQALPAEVLQAHGRVDIVVNNAGVSVGASFEDHTLEDLDWVLGINLWGVIYGCKFFLPLLRRQDEAYLVNISSVFGIVGVPSQSSYCASKFAVRGLSESLAAELVDSPVRVLRVHPGGIRTNIARDARYRGQARHLRDVMARVFERWAMPAEAAAARIVGAMERNAERVLIAREAHAIDALKRMAPVIPSAAMSWLHRRLGR